MVRYVTPIILILVGMIYLIFSLNLPKARIGDANGPLYFPIIVGSILCIMSVVYLFQEFRKRHERFDFFKPFLNQRTLKLLVGSIVTIVVYALIFERVGFLISTILFLGIIMFLVNGHKKWLLNIVVSIIFSTVLWYTFSVLLGVSLP
ncbi:tripartite tricarboxylate transporter TctB family protein [Staphylococcus massiliensis]|uniref:DUF1468 domain-containing protein n=1 Tax=Staphylococcus massiliensis S46 TaxID=1229783 RepID=K9B6S1_9STAP|nr:tripartite tricarboxylate transporter TctB family protein [Staphylococcus massiliensis]EKU50532.1 hypothetical protein C273_00885 [Staphylococcus massiliensis S46]POA00402.1 tripartite tricarboxylate transporter TctB family protein [Staphylococcus massiliensis CCUG 55927]